MLPILGKTCCLTACALLSLPLPVATQHPHSDLHFFTSISRMVHFQTLCRASLTWCALYAPSPRWSLLPTSAPAPIRHSETQIQRLRSVCTNAHIFHHSETHSRKYAVPQSQGPSPSRPPLQPPSCSHCGPRLTSTSGEAKHHEPNKRQYTTLINDWLMCPQLLLAVFSQFICYYD